jgi:hypothetical protein
MRRDTSYERRQAAERAAGSPAGTTSRTPDCKACVSSVTSTSRLVRMTPMAGRASRSAALKARASPVGARGPITTRVSLGSLSRILAAALSVSALRTSPSIPAIRSAAVAAGSHSIGTIGSWTH